MSAWVHGSWTVGPHVVEVREVFTSSKGFPPKSLGWESRLVIGDAELKTLRIMPTQKAAEDAIVNAANSITQEWM